MTMPEPVMLPHDAMRELGKRLAARLDEDDWEYIEPFLLAAEAQFLQSYESGRASMLAEFEFLGCAGILDDYFLSKSGLGTETKLYRLKGEK